jgi:hypothetical protein
VSKFLPPSVVFAIVLFVPLVLLPYLAAHHA